MVVILESYNDYLDSESTYLIELGFLDEEKSDCIYHNDPEEYKHYVDEIANSYGIKPLDVYLYCVRTNLENLFRYDLGDYLN